MFEIDPAMIEVDIDDGKTPGKKGSERQINESEGKNGDEKLLDNEQEKPKGLWEKIKTGGKKFYEFQKGIVFFTYQTENFDQFEDDIGTPPKKNVSLLNRSKFFLKILLGIAIFFSIIKQYIDVLGTEKSQSLKYLMHTDLTYDMELLPRLLPAHQFTYISKSEVESRLKCKVANNEAECKKIENLRCLAKGQITQNYEKCMININQLLQQNATEFCVNHYNSLDLWKDEMDPKYALYHQRKHDCYEFSGVPKGKAYCQDMRKYQIGWTQETLYNCYRKYSVDFATEYCNSLFQKNDGEATPEQKKQLLQCYGSKGVPKGKEFCDIENPGTDRQAVNNQIKCYDNNFVKSKGVCDAKEGFYYWQPSKLRQCYQAAGYVLDKAFCDQFYPLQSQIDERYVCYKKLDLPIVKDRQYCELKHPIDYLEKYQCVIELLCETQGEKGETQYNSCINLYKTEDRKNLPIQKGGDFCYQMYFWESEYEELYTCLEAQKFPKDSSYCLRKFEYLIGVEMQKPESERDSIDALNDQQWECLKSKWSINEDVRHCAAKIAAGGASQLVYPALEDSDYTVSYIKDPDIIANTGDKSLLQQSYFIGAAVKFFNDQRPDNEAGYLVAGNYPDITSSLKYGQISYYPQSTRDLFGADPKNFPEGTTSIPVLKTEFNEINGDNRLDSTSALEELKKLKDQVTNANWYFDHPNQLVVDFENGETYNVQYMANNKMSLTQVKPEAGEAIEYSLDNSDPSTLEVFAIQNFGDNLQTKIGLTQQDGQPAPNLECKFIQGASADSKPEITYTFNEKKSVQKVKIFNFKNGAKTSLLENAEIYVDGTQCAKVGPNPPVNEYLELVCETEIRNVFSKDYDPNAPPFEGIEGEKLIIKSDNVGIMSVCDIQIFAGKQDNSAAEGIKKCNDTRVECDLIMNNKEDKANCQAYFGEPLTPQYCLDKTMALDYSSFTSDQPQFYYSRRAKYECLADPTNSFGAVNLPDEVDQCLNLYYANKVEQCLYKYEKQYQFNMGFNKEMTQYLPQSANIAQLREAQRLAKAQEEYAARSGLSIQVALEEKKIDMSPQGVSDYFCNKWTKMDFYSNPFLQNPDQLDQGNFLNFSMGCEVFEFYDNEKEEEQMVVHYFFENKEPQAQNVQLEDIQNKFYINRTELNEQFFRMNFMKQLEFMEVYKVQMYMREQNPQNEQLDVPKISNQAEFDTFRSENVTLKMYETDAFNVSVDRVQETTLDSAPQTNSHLAMPKIGGKEILGYPVTFGDYEEKIFKFTPENDVRMIFKLDQDEIDKFDSLAINLNFRFTFTEQVFEYQYFSLKDLLADIGGVGGAIASALGLFGVYIIMLFIVDLIFIIKKKYKQEKRTHNIKIYGRKLKLYKEIITEKRKVIEDSHKRGDVDGHDHNQGDDHHEGGKKESFHSTYKFEAEYKELSEREKLDQDERMTDRLLKVLDPEYDHFKDNDINDAEDMDLDQVLDNQEEELLHLEEFYGDKYKKFNIKYQTDIFDDLVVTKMLYKERTRYKFMKIAELIKKRISFFGIYSLNDQVEMTQEKLGHMRKQLQVTFRLLLEHQNKLLYNFKVERKENVENIEQKFAEVKKKLLGKKNN